LEKLPDLVLMEGRRDASMKTDPLDVLYSPVCRNIRGICFLLFFSWG